MASFDPNERQPVADASPPRGQVPRHFLESKLQRFISTFPQLIEQLEKHAKNLRDFHRRGDYARMRPEMISASHTINRGQSNQQEFLRIRSEIPVDLLEKYEDRFLDSGVRLQEAVDMLHSISKQLCVAPVTIGDSSSAGSSSSVTCNSPSSTPAHHGANNSECCKRTLPLTTVTTSGRSSSSSSSSSSNSSSGVNSSHVRPQCIASSTGSLQFFYSEEDSMLSDDIESSSSSFNGDNLAGNRFTQLSPGPISSGSDVQVQDLNNLLKDVTELNELIHTFATSVQEQRQFVDSIGSNVDSSAVSIQGAVEHIGVAARLKSVFIPVACGTVGAVIAGPVGLFAGLKLGAVAAAGAAGVGGVLIGRRLKSKKEQQIEEELQHLQHSSS